MDKFVETLVIHLTHYITKSTKMITKLINMTKILEPWITTCIITSTKETDELRYLTKVNYETSDNRK